MVFGNILVLLTPNSNQLLYYTIDLAKFLCEMFSSHRFAKVSPSKVSRYKQPNNNNTLQAAKQSDKSDP